MVDIWYKHHTYHALYVTPNPLNWSTLGGVAIAEAVAPDNQLIHGIVVFLFDLRPRV